MDSQCTLVHIHITGSRIRVRLTLGEALEANTPVPGHSRLSSGKIHAQSIAAQVMIGNISTIIKVNRTPNTLIIGGTETVETSKGIQTGATVLAAQFGSRIVGTLVNILLTVGALGGTN